MTRQAFLLLPQNLYKESSNRKSSEWFQFCEVSLAELQQGSLKLGAFHNVWVPQALSSSDPRRSFGLTNSKLVEFGSMLHFNQGAVLVHLS